jgi:hypothetical protein
MFDSSATNRPVGTPLNKESPIDAVEKRIASAFELLGQAMKRLQTTFSPVVSSAVPTPEVEGKQCASPISPTQFERMINKIEEAIRDTTKEIHVICDHSVV